MTAIYIGGEVEAAFNGISFNAKNCYVKNGVLYLNMSVVFTSARTKKLALFRFKNHSVRDSTVYIVMHGANSNICIGYDPTNTLTTNNGWIVSVDDVPIGNYIINCAIVL